jgi:3-methylcrotonyl-CoA carboxylase alpha subunit
LGSWSLAGSRRRKFAFRIGTKLHAAVLVTGRSGSTDIIEFNGLPNDFRYQTGVRGLDVFLDGLKASATAMWSDRDLVLTTATETVRAHWVDPYVNEDKNTSVANRFSAPMPGAVTRILVEPGSSVTKGDPVLVIEAMKMEHTLRAPVSGRLVSLACTVGGFVEDGLTLGVFEAGED